MNPKNSPSVPLRGAEADTRRDKQKGDRHRWLGRLYRWVFALLILMALLVAECTSILPTE